MTETTSLVELKKLDVLAYPELAARMIVHDQKSLDIANQFVLGIKKMITQVIDTFKPITQKIDETKAATLEQKNGFLGPLNKAKSTADLKIITYVEDLKAAQREAEKKAQDAEAERLAGAQMAMEEAALLEEKGQAQEAEKMRERIPEFKPTVLPEVPKLKDAHVRENWKYKVTDLKLLAQMRPDLIMADSVKIGKIVRAQKEKAEIPGVEVWNESSLATRG